MSDHAPNTQEAVVSEIHNTRDLPEYIVAQPPAKAEWPAKAAVIVERLLESNNAVEALVALNAQIEIAKLALSVLRVRATDAMTEKEREIFGFVVKEYSLPSKWDYNNDPVLARLEGRMEDLEREIKDQQKFLQLLPMPEFPDETTGEVRKKATKIPTGVSVKIS